ncbi:YxeA family protein [Exiguobacterium sp. MER 193]|uniref:YxeA family protein n=1 Tax=Exiguobacterium sp. MER 193 TaxID=2939564 RepID=UPI002040BFBA|nr:YxeA family protein [Exiguobacterium sp. MER 193]MCM3280412.1 YxeA family protein [Exiguobacterium sp. MER 193]
MKRNLVAILLIGILLVVGWCYVDPNRLLADVYYVKVPSAEVVTQTSGGYRYDLIGYDEDGKKRPLSIATSGLLPEGNYLRVFVKEDAEVTDYEQVNVLDVPEQLKEEQEEDNSEPLFP